MAAGDDRVGLLFWEMTLDDDEFKAKIKDSKSGLDKLDKGSKSSLSSIAGNFALVGAAIGIVGAGLGALTISTIESIAEQKILADSIGATTAEIAGLEIASSKLGVESSQVIDKMREFGGIDEFKKLADDVKNAGGPVDQLAKSIEIFGGEGAKILPILQQGSAGLKEFENQAIATGLALSPEDTQKATEAWDAYKDLQFELKGAANQLGIALSGLVKPLADVIRLAREAGKATGETVEGFKLWIGELLGWEDATSKATTQEEALALKAKQTAEALKKQASAVSSLGRESEKTFSSGIFSQLVLEKELALIQKELNLTEEGFKKIKALASSSLGKGDTTTSIIETIRSLDEGDLFQAEDFKLSIDEQQFNKLKVSFAGDNKKAIADLAKERANSLKAISDKQKELESLRDPREFAGRAMAGSIEAFRILQGNDEPAKKTAEATTRMANQMAKWDVI